MCLDSEDLPKLKEIAERTGASLEELEDMLEGDDDFILNVGIRFGAEVYSLDRSDYQVEFIAED